MQFSFDSSLISEFPVPKTMTSEISFCEGLEKTTETHPLGCQVAFNACAPTILLEYRKIMEFSIEERAKIIFAFFEKVLQARKEQIDGKVSSWSCFFGPEEDDAHYMERIGEYAYRTLQEVSYYISMDYSRAVNVNGGIGGGAKEGLTFVKAFVVDGLDALQKKFGKEIFWIQFLCALDLLQANKRPDVDDVEFYLNHFETRADDLIAHLKEQIKEELDETSP